MEKVPFSCGNELIYMVLRFAVHFAYFYQRDFVQDEGELVIPEIMFGR